MNAPGEIAALAPAGPAACRHDHHHRARPISGSSLRLRRSPKPRVRFFGPRAGRRCGPLRRQSRTSAGSKQIAEAAGGAPRRSASVRVRLPNARLIDARLDAAGSDVAMARRWPSDRLSDRRARAALGDQQPGGARRAAALGRRRRARGAQRWPTFEPPRGRGQRRRIRSPGRRGHPDRRKLQRQPSLGARGARRARHRARTAGSPRSATCSNSATRRPRSTPSWPSRSRRVGSTACSPCGSAMRHLHAALPRCPPRRPCRRAPGAAAAARAGAARRRHAAGQGLARHRMGRSSMRWRRGRRAGRRPEAG